MNVIHVGGWHGDEYADHDGYLLIFEPQARPFAQLQRNLGGRDGVRLVHAAAGAQEDGEATMYRLAPDHSSSLLEPGRLRPGFSRDGTEVVTVTTVDSETAQLACSFDVLRIDAQGAEINVLMGAPATLLMVDRVEVELHDAAVYPGAATLAELDMFLAAFGLERTGYDEAGSDDLADVVYERAG